MWVELLNYINYIQNQLNDYKYNNDNNNNNKFIDHKITKYYKGVCLQ